jgi:hypothetical protein
MNGKYKSYMAVAALGAALAGNACADDREIFPPDRATQTGTGGTGGEAGNGAGAEAGSGGEAGTGGEAGQGGSETCTELETKCGSKCVDLYTDPDNCGACGKICDGVKQDCFNAVCQCESGTMECGEDCVDTDTDNNNCGGCGNVCDSNKQCDDGFCK